MVKSLLYRLKINFISYINYNIINNYNNLLKVIYSIFKIFLNDVFYFDEYFLSRPKEIPKDLLCNFYRLNNGTPLRRYRTMFYLCAWLSYSRRVLRREKGRCYGLVNDRIRNRSFCIPTSYTGYFHLVGYRLVPNSTE